MKRSSKSNRNGRVRFGLFGGGNEPERPRETKYSVHGTKVTYGSSRVLDDADAVTFQTLTDGEYAKDARSAFVRGCFIEGADVNSFRLIHSPYSRDRRRVYCGNIPMDVADLQHFELVRESWTWSETVDKVFFCREFGPAFESIVVSEESPAVVGHAWARDGQFYYYGPARVDGADYESFQIIDNTSAKDKHHTYSGILRDDTASQPLPATFP